MPPDPRPVSPLAVADVRRLTDDATDNLMGWVLAAVLLVTGHALQFVALGNAWKDDQSGWEFVGSEATGSGWAMWSVLLLAASFGVALFAIRERRPRLLWGVAAISTLRLVAVAVASLRADYLGTDFGVGLTIGIIVVTVLTAMVSSSLIPGGGSNPLRPWNR